MRWLLGEDASEGLEEALNVEAALSDELRPGDWLMTNMVTSLDGATARMGKSGGLATEGDRQVFKALRAQADLIVVGARTAIAEQYRTPTEPTGVLAERRRQRGQRTRPLLCMVSRSLNSLDAVPAVREPFSESERVMIVTTRPTASDPDWQRRRDTLTETAELVELDDPTLPASALLAELHLRVPGVLLTEGGPSFLAQLAPFVNEWNLSLAPHIVGGPSARMTPSETDLDIMNLRLSRAALDQEGCLFLRYINDHPARAR